MSIKRQFIAGAKCPECGAMDKIQRCQSAERTWMYCLACEMTRYMDEEPEAAALDESNEPQPVIWKSL